MTSKKKCCPDLMDVEAADTKTPRVLDVTAYFNPSTKLLSWDKDGKTPIDECNSCFLTNRLFSTLILRLRTVGRDPVFKNKKTIHYQWPSQDVLASSKKVAFFPHDPFIWISPTGDLMPPPVDLLVRRGSFGTTMVLSNANTFMGFEGQRVVYRFLITVYFDEKVYTTDPTVINEPFVPDTGGD